jgi:uncharacterized protein (UPF0335 family)
VKVRRDWLTDALTDLYAKHWSVKENQLTQTVIGGMDPDTVKRLQMHIEKIENLEQEKKTIADLVKDEFIVAKGAGFDPKIMKEILKMRNMDDDEIQEKEALLELYRAALGMLPN